MASDDDIKPWLDEDLRAEIAALRDLVDEAKAIYGPTMEIFLGLYFHSSFDRKTVIGTHNKLGEWFFKLEHEYTPEAREGGGE